MTVLHIFVDETKRRDYVMVAVCVPGDDLGETRAVVRRLLQPGQHHLHMKDESNGRKKSIARALVAANLRATVYDAGRRHRNQVLARAACLSAIIDDAAASDVESLIVLDQDETLIQFDRRLLYRSVHAIGREHDLHYQHRRSNAEQLLGIPDAFAWCWARGGQWRSLIRPAVTVKTI